MIRPLEREDLSSVVALHRRVLGVPVGPPPPQDLYYSTLFLDHPWVDPEIRPLVFEDEGGGIVGFLGVVARPMRFRERAIRIAVPTRFMRDPDRAAPIVGAALVRALCAGPQDATIIDGANETARRLWLGARAELAGSSSMHWMRPLRPAAYLRRRLGDRGRISRVAAGLALPLCAVTDALIGRAGLNDFDRSPPADGDRSLSAARLLPLIERASGPLALRPVYDEATLGWLLDQLRRMGRQRELRGAVVRGPGGREVGWYLYYLQRGAVGRVLQLGAERDAENRVLRSLLADAHEHGATMLRGRVSPGIMPALAHRRCYFTAGRPWTLIHSADRELCAALQRGDAFFSALEGEWW